MIQYIEQRTMAARMPARTKRLIRNVLLTLLVLFSTASIVFSLVILFSDFGRNKTVTPSQARGLFTVFIYRYLNEIHPQRLPEGKTWTVRNLNFPNNHMALVEATDGQTRSRIEFIYTIEYPKVRVLKINDVTNRDREDAQLTLIRYLGFLRTGDFANAAALYGGPVARLVPYGSKDAHLSQLLGGYCMKTSPTKQCLPFSISASRKDDDGTYQFTVSYRLPDNTPFALGDGKSEFTAEVEATGADEYKVTTLPFD